ncbi:MAG: hypothetical protein D6788_00590 [Planctomycetota bacterium]|nr:MAG: hypothetical protein D6788_00590 [Planctomycetota bacterium]
MQGHPWQHASSATAAFVLIVPFFCHFSAAPARGQSAVRALPTFPGEGATVTITITLHPPAGTAAAGAADTPPAGWTVSNISDAGTFDSLTGQVKWGPIFTPSDPTVLTYDVTVPTGATGNECFTGTVSFDGSEVSIGGESCFVTIPALTPAGAVVAVMLAIGAGIIVSRRLRQGTAHPR